MTQPPTQPSIIPADETEMRRRLMAAMAVDPSGATAAALAFAFVTLARSEGAAAALSRSTVALTLAADNTARPRSAS